MDWIAFTNRMSIFGDNLKFFGKSMLELSTIISVIFFWFIIFTFYQPYQRIAFIIIEFIRAGIIVFTTGFLMHYLFYFINEIIHKLQMNNISVKIRGKKK